MRKIALTILLLLAIATSFAQTPEQGRQAQAPMFGPSQALTDLQNLWDSLSPTQKNMFLTEVKHIMEPEVAVIEPGASNSDPPSDAIVLFDGRDIDKEWEEPVRGFGGTADVKPAVTWVIRDGAMESVQGSASIRTKRSFEDFQLHIEWKTPSEITGEGQGRGNSGIIIQGMYEVQILDSYNNRTYRNGQAGAIYMQYAPLVNVSRKPGEWQTFDIFYTAPRFKDSTSYFATPRITVIHNGVMIQNNVSIQGPTVSPGIPQYIITEHGPGPIQLQRHGNPVAFRNIWIREL